MKKKILILGAGGHALNVIDLLLHEQDEFEPVGILDTKAKGDVLGVPVLGDDTLLSKLKKDMDFAFPAIGFGEGVDNTLRLKVFRKIQEAGFAVPNLISEKAFVRSGVKMGQGNLIQAGSIVDTQSQLGDNIAIGLGVLIGHGCQVASHVTLSGGVIFNGGVRVGEGTFLGMGCILYKNIGSWCKISPGAVCMEEVADRMIAFGNPARSIPNLQIGNNMSLGIKNHIYIIAEAGVNHNGSLAEAKKLVRVAKSAGADAVKFQTYSVEECYNQKLTKPKRLKWARDLSLNANEFAQLARYCTEQKITFLSTAFDISSANILHKLGMTYFKIAASELCNFPMLAHMAQWGKPIILSVGMGMPEEIALSLKTITKHWPKSKGRPQIYLLHCVSIYPSPYEVVNLRKMVDLGKTFKVPVGFSDHSLGIELPIASAALGAVIVEKHFKAAHDAPCADAAVSLGPQDFKAMVDGIRHVELGLGQGGLGIAKDENILRQAERKAMCAPHDLKKGSLIGEADIILNKPTGEIGMENYFKVLGNRLTKDIKEGEQYTMAHLSRKFKI